MSSKSFYVYELWNPLTDTVFYVGKGTKSHAGYRRLSEHLKDTRYYKAGKFRKTHKFTTIAKIVDAGMIPEIKVVYETLCEPDAIAEEKRLIAQYGRRDIGTGILTNHTDGGEGMIGYRHTAEHIKRLKTDNAGGNATARPVVAICPDTNDIVHRFSSSQEASITLKGINHFKSNINSACRKFKRRIFYGYYWRYLSEYDSNENVKDYNVGRLDHSIRGSKCVNQIKNGIVIKTWKSASEVCRHYNNHVSTLHKYLKNGKEWNGFIWKYA